MTRSAYAALRPSSSVCADASDEAILSAMIDHPILVERPIVSGPAGARLCRPAETVHDLVQA